MRTLIAARISCSSETFKLSFPDDAVDRRKPGIKVQKGAQILA